ncbi:hypothetical protein GCM10011494_21650 [Novosphingobium endophyticum]|uniref:Uncharacterized protein n=1 Tax=Novosphingobium endophyticum TaxID=1955250 RepID=A0A916TSK4_9SPHN|nr:hypothetical protein [Novosphingobium endophyticum]GGC02821.1 hypothetical protein GCM10011494_21650 [Novosphingobium endophyticum]
MAIQAPDTDSPDLEAADITPTGELESCNHLLEDHVALMCFYDEKGLCCANRSGIKVPA